MSDTSGLIERIQSVKLVDHHCHGVVTESLDATGLERLMSESSKPAPKGCSNFQKPLGLGFRHVCAPKLDLPAGATSSEYIKQRNALGAEEVNRRFMQASGLRSLLVDTGLRPEIFATPDEISVLAGAPAHEIVRIEAVCEEAARGGVDGSDFLQAFTDKLAAYAKNAYGLKSIVAYRSTFKIDQTAPTKQDAQKAVDSWLPRFESGKVSRLEETDLIRYGLWIGAELCRERGIPLQLHVGVGDDDVYMYACDPTCFTDFLKAMDDWDVIVTLLHNYPFIREAGWLAEVFRNVYYDVGFVLNFTGAQGYNLLAQALEMGPFYKQLYSSDAYGLSEMYFLGATLFRKFLAGILADWVDNGMCSVSDADEIVDLIAFRNAERVYGSV